VCQILSISIERDGDRERARKGVITRWKRRRTGPRISYSYDKCDGHQTPATVNLSTCLKSVSEELGRSRERQEVTRGEHGFRAKRMGEVGGEWKEILAQFFSKLVVGPKNLDDGIQHPQTHGNLGEDLIEPRLAHMRGSIDAREIRI
jgi:hypothetical protein